MSKVDLINFMPCLMKTRPKRCTVVLAEIKRSRGDEPVGAERGVRFGKVGK